ncbi:MAG: acetoacetate--CoA ligase [Hyphomonadaceae bacterium]
MGVQEGDLLWRGSASFVEGSNLRSFMRWLTKTRHLSFETYEELRQWSVRDIDSFWASIWDYFDIQSDRPYECVLRHREMPGAEWFAGAHTNFAEHVLKHEAERPDAVVLHHSSETRALSQMSWRELGDAVRTLASRLREWGIKPGDRIVSYMPNVPETLIAMLATVAVGAIWSSAAPEFGPQTVIDRFRQIEPKILFAADGYRFGGKDFDRRAEVSAIADAVGSLERIVWLDYLGLAPIDRGDRANTWTEAMAGGPPPQRDFSFTRVAHDHPLWVLFSSGTTGLPKAIVHTHVGILAEFFKMGAFHLNLTTSSVMFFYSTTGWMMWNLLSVAPLLGGTAVLYDGSPSHPGLDLLWRLAEGAKATIFGASPTYIELMRKHGVVPKDIVDVSSIDTVLLSGSPSTPESFAWFFENVKADLWVTSQSGGTEFCSGVVVAAPTEPVYAGEIQVRALGADVRVLDDTGSELIDEVGELVVAQPMPSMPACFWGDKDYARYRDAYFDVYPGLWRHGDFIRINGRGGAYVYGRSDSTLNRYGVRIGSSEIYRTIEGIDEVLDSLIVCIEKPNGGFYMPLFVQTREGASFDDELAAKINSRLRIERSPRHVPDVIIAAPAIPYTLSGKKMEVPVRKLLMGWSPERCFSRDAMKDGAAMDWFVSFARTHVASEAKRA